MVRGRKRNLDPARKVEANLSASIHNRFDVEVIDARTGEVRQRAQAENVICEQLWTRLFTPADYFNYIHYGTGDGTPTASDTSLFAFLGALWINSNDNVVNSSHAECWFSLQSRAQLAENAEVGQILTEVGIAHSAGANTLCTHAILKDMNGNQISIEKTDTDIINIYATVFVHWPASLMNDGIQVCLPENKSVGFLTYLAGKYDKISYMSTSASPPNYACLTTSRKRLTVSASDSSSINSCLSITAKYELATKSIKLSMNRAPVAADNLAGGAFGVVLYQYNARIGSYDFMSSPDFYLEVGNPWFHQSVISGEAIGSGDGATMDFATLFDCPESAVIYVDGVADSTVRVEAVPLASDAMWKYFDIVTVENGIAYPDFKTSNPDEGNIYQNRYWEYGIKSISCGYYCAISVSDDLINWEYIVGSDSSKETPGSNYQVPAALQRKKYWRMRQNNISGAAALSLTGKNIHFPTPPPAGAVITADYTTKCIAKDANHVFDLTVTIHLGEYQA